MVFRPLVGLLAIGLTGWSIWLIGDVSNADSLVLIAIGMTTVLNAALLVIMQMKLAETYRDLKDEQDEERLLSLQNNLVQAREPTGSPASDKGGSAPWFGLCCRRQVHRY
mmetsp:Transcript_37349/g.68952  ORF Transcript_37349/g.68952 Transcript_37349/m.68952 type:complete len:110 (-) Transcript_37349:46-375(-)